MHFQGKVSINVSEYNGGLEGTSNSAIKREFGRKLSIIFKNWSKIFLQNWYYSWINWTVCHSQTVFSWIMVDWTQNNVNWTVHQTWTNLSWIVIGWTQSYVYFWNYGQMKRNHFFFYLMKHLLGLKMTMRMTVTLEKKLYGLPYQLSKNIVVVEFLCYSFYSIGSWMSNLGGKVPILYQR